MHVFEDERYIEEREYCFSTTNNDMGPTINGCLARFLMVFYDKQYSAHSPGIL